MLEVVGSSSSPYRQWSRFQRNHGDTSRTRRNLRRLRLVPHDSQSTSLEESAFGSDCFVGGTSNLKWEWLGVVEYICSSWSRLASPSWRKQTNRLGAVEEQENSCVETTEDGQSKTPLVLLGGVETADESVPAAVPRSRAERQKREKPFPIRLRDELED